MKSKLDFIIIGAQKSGTTTLFELLKQHTSIYLPPEKEAFFFGRVEREKNGWEWYIKEFFSDAPEDKLWGTITPNYMDNSDIAAKIKHVIPDVKIISILREPFSRTYSHFLMSKRRDFEDKSYYEVISNLAEGPNLDQSRAGLSETSSYIARSEYGRILNSYKKEFGKENMLILYTEDLEKSPQKVIDDICDFLNVAHFSPEGIGKKFHIGSSEPKFLLLTKALNSINKSVTIKKALKKIIPFKYRRRFVFKIDQWNISTKKSKAPDDLPHEVEEVNHVLKPIFLKDAELFEKEFNLSFPWSKELK